MEEGNSPGLVSFSVALNNSVPSVCLYGKVPRYLLQHTGLYPSTVTSACLFSQLYLLTQNMHKMYFMVRILSVVEPKFKACQSHVAFAALCHRTRLVGVSCQGMAIGADFLGWKHKE